MYTQEIDEVDRGQIMSGAVVQSREGACWPVYHHIRASDKLSLSADVVCHHQRTSSGRPR